MRRCRHRTDSDQREPHPPRFVSRPPPPWAGNNTRHKHPLGQAGDVTRFWLGRSAARRLLSSRNHRKSGESNSHKSNPAPIAWKGCPNRKADKFYPNHARKDTTSWAKQGGEQTQSFNIWSLKVAWASSRICFNVTSHCSQRANRIIVSRMGPLRSRNASA